MVTINAVHSSSAATLRAAGVDEPVLEASLLIGWVLDRPRSWVLAHGDEELDILAQERLTMAIQRRAAREPLAYIIGHKAWRDLDILVDQRVLIPRPETEELADIAIDLARMVRQHRPLSLLVDVGTGSGILAIALARALSTLASPEGRVIAIDLNPAALQVAAENCRRLDIDGRLEFRQGALLSPLTANEHPDVIVANLPYIPQGEIENLQPEVRLYEPHHALDGGLDGLDLIRELIDQSKSHLAVDGYLALEIGHDQGAAVRAYGDWAFGAGATRIVADAAGRDRFAIAHGKS